MAKRFVQHFLNYENFFRSGRFFVLIAGHFKIDERGKVKIRENGDVTRQMFKTR